MSDSSSEEDEEELLELEESNTATEQQQQQQQEKESLVPTAGATPPMAGGGAKSLAPLPGTVGSSGVTDSDLAQAEQLVNEGAQSKYAEQPSADDTKVVPPLDQPDLLRAKSVHTRRGSIHGAELASSATGAHGWQKLIRNKPPGGVKLSARDHKNVVVSYWEFNQDTLRARQEDHPDGPSRSPGAQEGGGIQVADLKPFLDRQKKVSSEEKTVKQNIFDKLSKKDRSKAMKAGQWPKTDTCRWFHLPGCSHRAVDIFTESYHLDKSVAAACKAVSGKPICSWHQVEDKTFDHLFVAAHYIQKSSEEADDGISGFVYEQVFMIFYPALNTIISIDANGEKTWDGVTDLLCNECGFVRTNEDTSVLIYKLLDSMIDEVYPLLDLYGDLLENLEFETMAAPEPTDEHVRTSFKLKRRVHSLRRYAWGMRQLLQELRQNNFGVITKDTIKMMTSVERNAENMVEVACAYMEQCTGIESFYDSFQEKVQGSTLYILTITSVTIMPFQFLTGLFGASCPAHLIFSMHLTRYRSSSSGTESVVHTG